MKMMQIYITVAQSNAYLSQILDHEIELLSTIFHTGLLAVISFSDFLFHSFLFDSLPFQLWSTSGLEPLALFMQFSR